MKKNSSTDHIESTILGWKFIAIVGVLTTFFLTFFYLAMTSEPDYMPSQKQKTPVLQLVPTNTSQSVD